jgi:ABC-type glycerol-3-phosphate transport system substrate-binding protein
MATLQALQTWLTDAVRKGEPGDTLPTERELATKFGLARNQVRHALVHLAERQAIRRVRRLGTVISENASERLKASVSVIRKSPSHDIPGSPKSWIHQVERDMDELILADHPGIRLECAPDETHYSHGLSAWSGQPSLLTAGHTLMPEAISYGVSADLTERVAEWETGKDIWPSLWEVCTRDGRIYGIPKAARVFMLFCNAKVMKAAGLNPDRPPETWDNLAAQAIQMTNPAANRWGIGLADGDPMGWLFSDLCLQAGGNVIEKSAQGWQPTFHHQECVGTLEFLRSLKWEQEVIAPGLRSDNDVLEAFLNDRIGMCWATSAAGLTAIGQNGRDPSDFVVAPLPAGPRGHTDCHFSVIAYTISKSRTEEEIDAAWEFATASLAPEMFAEASARLWEHGVVDSWPSIYRNVSAKDTSVGLPESWFREVTRSLATARPEPFAQGWNADIGMGMAVRRILQDRYADPKEELTHAAELVAASQMILS